MIKIHNVVKAFGDRVALRGVNLQIREGEFVALLGANGAGKTTLLHIIATLSRPTAGEVFINGYRLAEAAGQLRRFIGLVSHKSLLYQDLTAAQNLRFYARLYDLAEPDRRIETTLRQVELWERRDDPVRAYSRGMQQRLTIARAILPNPPILLLDEPDTGLDQHASERLGRLLSAVGADRRTILMTTHNLERGLALGHRLVILAKGKIAYDTRREDVTAEELRTQYYKYTTIP